MTNVLVKKNKDLNRTHWKIELERPTTKCSFSNDVCEINTYTYMENSLLHSARTAPTMWPALWYPSKPAKCGPPWMSPDHMGFKPTKWTGLKLYKMMPYKTIKLERHRSRAWDDGIEILYAGRQHLDLSIPTSAMIGVALSGPHKANHRCSCAIYRHRSIGL